MAARSGTNISALGRDPARLFDALRDDVSAGKLPAVSWIVAPEAFSEHPNHAADFGAWFTSQVIEILAGNPEVFSRTVLFVNYDEEGGFFDHMVPPTPPFAGQGASTVDPVNEIYPAGDASHPSAPYGLGMRVPMVVVSPWSKGGWVNSQVFDHTSLIRFIETRYARECPGLFEPNITPWRRAVTGDLTSTLDFSRTVRDRVRLPDTSAWKPASLVRHPDYAVVAPSDATLPIQEPGVRPARALPYELHVDASANVATRAVQVNFGNTGAAAAVFHVRSSDVAQAPRTYTVEPQRLLSGRWPVAVGAAYGLSVSGPNGFLRTYKGRMSADATQLLVRASYDTGRLGVTLFVTNVGAQAVELRVSDAYAALGAGHGRHHGEHTGDSLWSQRLRPGQSTARAWPLARSSGWYDFTLQVEGDAEFGVQLAGHVENGEASISDPLMARVTLGD